MRKNKGKSLNVLVSEAMRRLRYELGISQEELADRCGLDRTYISAVERGRRNITIGSLSKIISSLSHSEKSFLQELIRQIDISGDSEDE